MNDCEKPLGLDNEATDRHDQAVNKNEKARSDVVDRAVRDAVKAAFKRRVTPSGGGGLFGPTAPGGAGAAPYPHG